MKTISIVSWIFPAFLNWNNAGTSQCIRLVVGFLETTVKVICKDGQNLPAVMHWVMNNSYKKERNTFLGPLQNRTVPYWMRSIFCEHCNDECVGVCFRLCLSSPSIVWSVFPSLLYSFPMQKILNNVSLVSFIVLYCSSAHSSFHMHNHPPAVCPLIWVFALIL